MATITLKGNEVHTLGALPEVGNKAPDFILVDTDLSEKKLSDYKGKVVILNIFPSLDTETCAMSVREFNEKVSDMENTVVLCISKDLPFAQKRFCAAEGLDNVIPLSAFRSNFGKEYNLEFSDGPLKGLFSRSVIVLNVSGEIIYKEQVAETTNEPNYEKVMAAILK
ncbi:thiol peroxidase, atypical 2-Cys peroxiredoxin [Apibacter mensalis]|uniref:Thiol peroxidase n=1 Tax=Apibacter mensalis TaxID=1586267 RepID=A0A0X3AN72_9FLAO|nr:thiol peroxidase [Apibacter mensalis]CVK15831.1 thiol peroxidase, atypical 2-Cys peroxiredoxin [Apibacter mensalis]